MFGIKYNLDYNVKILEYFFKMFRIVIIRKGYIFSSRFSFRKVDIYFILNLIFAIRWYYSLLFLDSHYSQIFSQWFLFFLYVSDLSGKLKNWFTSKFKLTSCIVNYIWCTDFYVFHKVGHLMIKTRIWVITNNKNGFSIFLPFDGFDNYFEISLK